MHIADWSFLVIVATILVAPGPTNTLFAAAGIGRGLRGSWRLIPLACLGYFVAATVWGALLSTMAIANPLLLQTVKVVSGCYIAWLGWSLWRQASGPLPGAGAESGQGAGLLVATLLNPKAALFGIALFPVETWLSVANYGRVMSAFMLLVAATGLLWIALGSALMVGRLGGLQPQTFQRVAALTLFGFSIWLVTQGLGDAQLESGAPVENSALAQL